MSNLIDALQTLERLNFDPDKGRTRISILYDRIGLELADALNIDRDFVFTMENIGEGLRPTAIVRINENKRPWAVFEAIPSRRVDNKEDAKRRIKRYLHYTNAEIGALFSPEYILVFDEDGTILHDVETDDESDIRKIQSILSPPEIYIEENEGEEYDDKRSQEYVFSPNYKIDLKELEEKLELMDSMESAQEKGDAFEEFAGVLMEAMPFIKVRKNKLRTKTSELDLVVEYTGAEESTFFDKVSSYFLIECKHWTKAVGADEVRNFSEKMNNSKIDFGIMFARNGVTGDDRNDGYGAIQKAHIRSDNIILVVDDEIIERILSGENFYKMLEELYIRRKFDER